MKFNVKVDTRAFDKAFSEYKQNCKREVSEIVAKKVYFIARNAVTTTETANGEKIKSELLATSRTSSTAPIAAILVNKKRKEAGKKGLNGVDMSSAVDKFIRARERTKNWLRSGWLAAVKAMEKFVPNKGGAPKMPRVTKKGFGGASVRGLFNGWRPSASIWNSIIGNMKVGSEAKVTPILEKGLQKAIDKETASMQQYIQRQLQKHHDKFNRS